VEIAPYLQSVDNTLPIVELHKMQLLTLAHKYLFHRSTLPEAYSIHLISCRLSYGHRCIKSKAASLWNALPIELKNDMSVSMFKKKLSYYLLSML
jgi:hypothetical protein